MTQAIRIPSVAPLTEEERIGYLRNCKKLTRDIAGGEFEARGFSVAISIQGDKFFVSQRNRHEAEFTLQQVARGGMTDVVDTIVATWAAE